MIVDTNVIVTVDDQHPNAPPHCVLRCLEVLRNTDCAIIALDAGDEILAEYLRNVARGGYPLSVGAQFVRELANTRHDLSRCEQVGITAHPERGYEEFPDDARLEEFDRSDRKFAAVAIASPNGHQIFNAVDSDWAEVDPVLREHGVDVVYLCPSYTAPAELQPSAG